LLIVYCKIEVWLAIREIDVQWVAFEGADEVRGGSTNLTPRDPRAPNVTMERSLVVVFERFFHRLVVTPRKIMNNHQFGSYASAYHVHAKLPSLECIIVDEGDVAGYEIGA
jgi:hypothetical protein